MQDYSSTNQPPAQEGGDSYRRIDLLPHAHARMLERGGDRKSIRDRVQMALREHKDLRGACALNACSPVIVAELRSTRVVIRTLLELGMPIKSGTKAVQA